MQIIFILILSFLISSNLYPGTPGEQDFIKAKKMAASNPSSIHCLKALARQYEKIDKFSDASKIYQKCLDLEPDNPENYLNLAESYENLGRPDLSRNVLTNAVRYFDRNARIYEALGSSEYKLGKFRQAFTNYLKAMEFSGERQIPFIQNGLGKVCRELKEYDKAEAYFQKSLRAKDNCWTYYEYGKLFEEKRNYEQAIWAYRRSRALSYNQDEKYSKAIDNRLAAAYYAYGMKLKDTGRKDAARSAFNKILTDRGLQKTPASERAAFWLRRL